MKNNNRGSAIIEFVIVMPLFFLMLFGMLYGGIMLHDYNGLNELTRAAARAGAIEQTDDSDPESEAEEATTKKVARIKKFIADNGNNYLLLYEVDNDDVSVTDDAQINGEDAIQVVVSATRTEDIPLIVVDLLPETISSSMSMRIEK